jgi:microcystin-dependent protein
LATNSKAKYTATGATRTFTVPFQYLDKSHVVVKLNGSLKTSGTDYTFTSASTINFTTAPTGTVEIYRSTPTDPLVDFQDASVLTEADLDTSARQPLYLAQESADSAALSLTVPIGETGMVLPVAASRASTLMGFDAAGALTTYAYGLLSGFPVTTYVQGLFSKTAIADACAYLGAAKVGGDTFTGPVLFSATIPATSRDTRGATTAWVTSYDPPGIVKDFAGTVIPAGYLLCDGASYSTTSYPELFAAIGTTWGTAGAGTFKVPNLIDGRYRRGGASGQVGTVSNATSIRTTLLDSNPAQDSTTTTSSIAAGICSVDVDSTTSMGASWPSGGTVWNNASLSGYNASTLYDNMAYTGYYNSDAGANRWISFKPKSATFLPVIKY